MSFTIPPFLPHFGFMLKDVGARLTLMGRALVTNRAPFPVCRHQNIRVYRTMMPWTVDAAWVAPNAMVMGNVALGHDTAIFYHVVIRNLHTKNPTKIGDHTVVMDRASFLGQVEVGANSYIGQGVTLDCCQIHDGVYIGAGASIGLGAVVENGAIVAPGSVVGKDVRVPAGELWAGAPAEKVSDVTHDQEHDLQHMVHENVRIAKEHAHAFHAHVHATEELSAEWLEKTVALMEAQYQQIRVASPVEFPVEAKRFLEPRVYQRRPEMHLRMSYPVNRMAPWMPKLADQVSNA